MTAEVNQYEFLGHHRGGRRHVRFGSKADICSAKRHVRFTPTPIADIGRYGWNVR
jgi:hypothetical protein